jgi:D-arabinose 1-dehydrogenase-like Zn-dependent alcohol dehydrogenase
MLYPSNMPHGDSENGCPEEPTLHELHTYHYSSTSSSYQLRTAKFPLPPRSILVRTTHSGICFTDVHAKPSGCGLGHEGIGIVSEVGIGVAPGQFKPGDRVGWGWLNSSCGHCGTCVSGYRQYCAEAQGFAFSDTEQGAFGDGRIVDAEFAYHIPDGVASEYAAPLMCAGASVYEALDAAGTRSHQRVGVVGLGGLGHMAVLFAKAMGCGVTVFSSSVETGSKREDALKLGADEVVDLKQLQAGNNSEMAEDFQKVDVLLITANAVPDLVKLLPFLARRATIVLMTIQQDTISIPYMEFVLPGHRLIASTEASRENHLRMLEFADRHQVKPWIETFAMTDDGLKEAFNKLENGEMRYRGVLVRQS